MLMSFIQLYGLRKLDYGLYRNLMPLNYFAKYERLKGNPHKNYLMTSGHKKTGSVMYMAILGLITKVLFLGMKY